MSFSTSLAAAVDSIVAAIAPEAALRRAAARARMNYANRRAQRLSAYAGADSRSWDGRRDLSDGSADSDLDEATLAALRERSRALVRNTPGARAMTGTLADNIAGSGLRPRLSLPWRQLGITRDRAHELKLEANAVWRRWYRHADSGNRQTFLAMQHLAVSSAMVNGDCFAIPVYVEDARRKSRYSLKVELVEGDRCDTPRSSDPVVTAREIRNGVELGGREQPVAYWFHIRHPGERWKPSDPGSRRMRRYAADRPDGRPNVLHVYDPERIGQSRGLPVLSSTVEAWRQIADYVDSELEAANAASLIAGYVTSEQPELAAAAGIAAGGSDGMPDGTGAPPGGRLQNMAPAAIHYLAPGEDIKFSQPGRPSANFGSFVETICRWISSSLGMSYPIAMRDFAGTTYSQARADLLEAWRMFQRRQQWLADRFCQPIWALLLEEAWMLGDFSAPPSFVDDVELWTATQWIAPGRGWIDPQKEVAAYSMGVELGFMDRQEVIAGMSGRDFDDVHDQLEYEREARAEADAAKTPKAPAPAQNDGSSSGDGSGDDSEDDQPDDQEDTEE